MPRSLGTMGLVAGNPVVAGTNISDSVHNNTMNDIANEITNSLPRDGTAPPTANLPMGGYKFTGMAYGLADTDSAAVGQIESAVVQIEAAVGQIEAALVGQIAKFKQPLNANITYYVRTNGNNANTGLLNTAGGAFLTIQKALDTIKNTLDLNGFSATIQVADGVYNTGGFMRGGFTGHGGSSIGTGIIYILGNLTTPANCLISTVGDAIYTEGAVNVNIQGFKLQTATSGRGLTAYFGAAITYANIDFGACVGAQVEIGTGGSIVAGGNYAISGGAQSHFHAGSEGAIIAGAVTCTLTGTPAFSAYFAGAAEGSITVKDMAFVGAATGVKFLAHKNGTIDVGANNLNFLPGSLAGTTNWGGIYATTNRTFTPVLTFVTPGDLNVVYSTQAGNWSREGDMVYVTGQIITSTFTKTTASGAMLINGLPFTTSGIANVFAEGSLAFQNITKAGFTQFTPYTSPNSTQLAIECSGSGQVATLVQAADMPSGGQVILRFSLTYKAATTG